MWQEGDVLTMRIRSHSTWFVCEVYDVLGGEPRTLITTTDDVCSWLSESLVPWLLSSQNWTATTDAGSA
jgi:hypothetical protein